MRKFIGIAAVLLLLDCAKPAAPASPPASQAAPQNTTQNTTPDEPPPTPLQTDAMGILLAPEPMPPAPIGMSFNDESVTLDSGVHLLTTMVWSGSALEKLNDQGVSYADIAPGADNGAVDLRRVDRQETSGQPPYNDGLCSDRSLPSYVAVVRDDDTPAVSIIAFSGDDQPGPMAHNTQVCTTLSFPTGVAGRPAPPPGPSEAAAETAPPSLSEDGAPQPAAPDGGAGPDASAPTQS